MIKDFKLPYQPSKNRGIRAIKTHTNRAFYKTNEAEFTKKTPLY